MLEHIDRRRKGRSVFLIECDQAILLAQFSAESLLSCAARCKQKPRCTAKKLWIVLKFPLKYPNQRSCRPRPFPPWPISFQGLPAGPSILPPRLAPQPPSPLQHRSEEHTSALKSLMRISYAA